MRDIYALLAHAKCIWAWGSSLSFAEFHSVIGDLCLWFLCDSNGDDDSSVSLFVLLALETATKRFRTSCPLIESSYLKRNIVALAKEKLNLESN